MKFSICFVLIVAVFSACSITHPLPSDVGTITLHNYALNENVALNDSINYKIFTNPTDFSNVFHATKSLPSKVVVPDFNAQQVVAVILRPTDKVTSIQIDKAQISGSDLNIYYSITDTATRTTFEHIPAVAATVPKSLSVKQVTFYNGTSKGATLPVKY